MVKMSPVREFGSERGAMAAFVLSSYLQGGALIYSSQEVAFPGRVDFFHYCHIDWNANNAIRTEYEILMKLYNDYPAILQAEKNSELHCVHLPRLKNDSGPSLFEIPPHHIRSTILFRPGR